MFSPTLAHFEPLHIGFNMMSLHTLGLELEDGYGSIVFFVYNVALIMFTTVVSHSRCAVSLVHPCTALSSGVSAGQHNTQLMIPRYPFH